MWTISQLKYKALGILLKETFSYIDQKMYKAYTALAVESAQLQGRPRPQDALFFMYQGTVYPDRTPNNTSVAGLRVNALPLHYSLTAKLKEIQNMLESSDYVMIRNFFSAVLLHSYNSVVLNTFLPHILLSALQKEFTAEEYAAIDCGTEPSAPTISPETTQNDIHMIQTHYTKAMEQLKNILMERFLLQT